LIQDIKGEFISIVFSAILSAELDLSSLLAVANYSYYGGFKDPALVFLLFDNLKSSLFSFTFFPTFLQF
jgi:hypothetical protein